MKQKKMPLALRGLTNPVLFALLVLFILPIKYSAQTNIGMKTGQNAWYFTDQQMGSFHGMYNPVSKSGAKFMRIGGIHFNYRPLFTFDANNGNIQNLDNLKEVIDSCRAAGIEPIIQVGYCPASLTCPPNTDLINNGTMYKKNFNLQTTIAANLVDALKNAYSTKPLLYYSIGNEPDLDTNCRANSWGGYRWDGSAITPQQTADSIATYLKAFSKAMKNIDNRIKIIGPEFADWNSDTASPIHRVMRRLVSIPNHCCPGKTKSSDFVF